MDKYTLNDLNDLEFEAENISSLCNAIFTALINGDCESSAYHGAMHILSDLLYAHAKKIACILENGDSFRGCCNE